ncbi:tripartite tricarboxylate transporter substrate binding protein [Microvirga massiliensis]|uniref:tripartite tricarboxylate transporter substrate binding protein n=1 Tax=Microvirga massiliensis TaxID=1033741 RepID=UPI000660E371|nr:tripartite tricarboxylate transporter substrate binding protein [Microvirga massiliensis]
MWPAGGGADTATRTFTRYLEKELGQTIVVKNVVGGGASIGYSTAKAAKPDGYNLVTIQGDLPKFAPMKLAPIEIDDFDIIAGFAVQSPIILVRADSPWKTLQDFIGDAKNNPGKRTIGVSDIGGVHHQPVVLWSKQAGIELRAIAHAGSPQMNAAILGGHIDAVSSYIRPALPYIQEGKVRALGYFGEERASDLPAVPTFKESGFSVVWDQAYGIGGPAGLPTEAKEALRKATEKVWTIPAFEQELNKLGLILYTRTGAELRESLVRMQAGIAEVLSILNATGK